MDLVRHQVVRNLAQRTAHGDAQSAEEGSKTFARKRSGQDAISLVPVVFSTSELHRALRLAAKGQMGVTAESLLAELLLSGGLLQWYLTNSRLVVSGGSELKTRKGGGDGGVGVAAGAGAAAGAAAEAAAGAAANTAAEAAENSTTRTMLLQAQGNRVIQGVVPWSCGSEVMVL